MANETQPAPVEGPRTDDTPVPANDGVSAQEPAEGSEDAAPRQPGSPRG